MTSTSWKQVTLCDRGHGNVTTGSDRAFGGGRFYVGGSLLHNLDLSRPKSPGNEPTYYLRGWPDRDRSQGP